MANDAQRFAFVMRTLLAAIAILMITGVFPAMASFGSCAAKPCCAHAAAAIDTHSSCCDEAAAGSMTTPGPAALTQRSTVREHPIVITMATIAPPPLTIDRSVHQPRDSRAMKRPPESIAILLI